MKVHISCLDSEQILVTLVTPEDNTICIIISITTLKREKMKSRALVNNKFCDEFRQKSRHKHGLGFDYLPEPTKKKKFDDIPNSEKIAFRTRI